VAVIKKKVLKSTVNRKLVAKLTDLQCMGRGIIEEKNEDRKKGVVVCRSGCDKKKC
jgi:hypothetical protein